VAPALWDVERSQKPKTGMKMICRLPEQTIVGLHYIGMGADELMQVCSAGVTQRALALE